MTNFYAPCPYCGGTGRVKHECTPYNLETLRVIYEFKGESLGIYRCRTCGQLWKIRWQCDSTGSDNIWLKPGERRRGYEFTLEEAGAKQNG